MATVVPNPVPPSSARTSGEGPSVPPAPPSFAPRPQRDEPGAARSAVPVVVSVGLLFGLAVAAAFVGRGIIEMLTGMLGQ
ncbi:hypothetical protein [Cellulosimicrobium sp. Marseille-Q4280]|uniref:hypothetical protein n=1 Tax=Cellulosimicrobium sp. Marseille-Q4280 TaxID=2937992 RepID=UPI00203AD009|nr:hypothetical protein [Cellulosimicrobium sp. Marseille-Q4280]